MIYPLKMVVFHSYVSLPEGINILESAKKSPAFRPFFAWPMIKFTRKCSCLAKNWRTGPWLLQQYPVWVWTCGKKQNYPELQCLSFFYDIWVKWSTINLRVAYFQRNLCCFWEISVFELHPHPSRQDGRRREVMTRIPPPPKKEQLHLSLRLYSVDRFWQRWEDKVRWFAGLVLVFWSSVLNSLYHKTQ